MVVIAPRQRADMDARHAARRRRTTQKKATSAVARTGVRNVQEVLDLGNSVYFSFRGRPYRIPPLPYDVGRQLVALRLEANRFHGELTAETSEKYFAVTRKLPALLWRHSRPVGRFRKWLRRIGLHVNPFQQATEAELWELADFFIKRRMKSGVGFPRATE